MILGDIFLFLGPLVAGLVSSYVTYHFTIKTKRSEAMLRFKEEKYANLLVLLKSFIGKTASSDLKRKFFDEQYRSWLYCSDDVVKAINYMVKLVIDSKGTKPDTEKGREAIGNIVKAMRKDLLGKTNLSYNDFIYTDVRD